MNGMESGKVSGNDSGPAAAECGWAQAQISLLLYGELSFDEEEKVFIGAVIDCGLDARAVQVVQRADEKVLFMRGENALFGEHPRVRVVDFEQSVEEILFGVFKVVSEYGFRVNRRGKRFRH